jgi:hypothetical protein
VSRAAGRPKNSNSYSLVAARPCSSVSDLRLQRPLVGVGRPQRDFVEELALSFFFLIEPRAPHFVAIVLGDGHEWTARFQRHNVARFELSMPRVSA